LLPHLPPYSGDFLCRLGKEKGDQRAKRCGDRILKPHLLAGQEDQKGRRTSTVDHGGPGEKSRKPYAGDSA
jgi:hypothetical protein